MARPTSKTCLAEKLHFPAKKTGLAKKKGRTEYPVRPSLVLAGPSAEGALFARLAVSLAGGLSEVTAL